MLVRIVSCLMLLAVVVLAISPGPLAAEDPLTIRVLTYNIHHGEGNDGKFDLERLGQVIKEQEPDLVALQEVDVKTNRASGVDQISELQRHSGLPYKAFFEAMPYNGGSYGEGILSRWPIVSEERIGLTSLNNGEPRALGRVDVALGHTGEGEPQANLIFFATHLDHRRNEDERVVSAGEINAAGGREADAHLPKILAGDLNAQPGSKPIQVLRAAWIAAKAGDEFPKTFPSTEPQRTIDFVMYRGPGEWKVTEVKVIDEPVASDHCPVLVVLEWQPE